MTHFSSKPHRSASVPFNAPVSPDCLEASTERTSHPEVELRSLALPHARADRCVERIFEMIPPLNSALARAGSFEEIIQAYAVEGVTFSDVDVLISTLQRDWKETIKLCCFAAKSVPGLEGPPCRRVVWGETVFELVGEVHIHGIPRDLRAQYLNSFALHLNGAKHLLLEDGLSQDSYSQSFRLKDHGEISGLRMVYQIADLIYTTTALSFARLSDSFRSGPKTGSSSLTRADLVASLILPDGRPRSDFPTEVYSGDMNLPAPLLLEFLEKSRPKLSQHAELNCSMARSIYMVEYLREYAHLTAADHITFRSGLVHMHHIEHLIQRECINDEIGSRAVRDCRAALDKKGSAEADGALLYTTLGLGVVAAAVGLSNFPLITMPIIAGLVGAGFIGIKKADREVHSALKDYIQVRLGSTRQESI